MDDHTRRKLLEQVQRPSQTIGEEMPEELTVQSETINLTEFVFECQRLERVSETQREEIADLIRRLLRERLKCKQTLQRSEITEEEGNQLVQRIHGIDRALNALEGIEGPDIEEQQRRKQIEDARELQTLIEQARI